MKTIEYNGKVIATEKPYKIGLTLIECTGEGAMKQGVKYIKSLATELCYNYETSEQVIQIIDTLFTNRKRVEIDFGNVLTGQSWGEVNDIKGRIGRSTGSIKIPLLVYNSRSHGGGSLLTHCIVKIQTTQNKRVLFINPKYQPAK